MSDKYCPAGKCECGCFYEEGRCWTDSSHEVIPEGAEVCPWPSRQVRVEPQAMTELQTKLHEVKSKIMEMEIREHIKMEDEKYNAAYLAGRREQARVDRDAVEKIELPPDADWFRASTWVEDALTDVAPEDK